MTDGADATNVITFTEQTVMHASFLDAEVDEGDSDAAVEMLGPFKPNLLNNMVRNLRLAGGSPKVILTGYDTIQAIADLLQSQERFMDRKKLFQQ